MNLVDKAFEDETIEVEYLLVEPQNDQVSVDCVLHFDKKNLKIEDVPCISGGSDSNITQEGEDVLKDKVLNSILYKVEVGNFQAANGTSNACEDYLLDVFSENVINSDPGPSKSHLVNTISQNQNPGLNGANNCSLELSDSPTALIPLPECNNAIFNKASYEFHGISGFTCTFKSLSEDELEYTSSLDLQNVHTLEDVSSLLPGGITSSKNDEDINFLPESGGMPCTSTTEKNEGVGGMGEVIERGMPSGGMSWSKSAIVNHKRLRKPTQRYIDELSNSNSSYCGKRREVSTSTMQKRSLGLRCYKHSHTSSRAMRLFPDESSAIAIQVPFGSPVRKESQKWQASKVKLDEGTSPPKSDHNCMMAVRSENEGGRRKHHRPWTVSEVRKLIDGVSQYGVGKWSHIKRLLFSSSTHRTSVDLKDKWRNLLKASGVQKQGKKEVQTQKLLVQEEHKRNHAWRPLPKYMLRRVSELACMYPYPGGHKSEVSRASHTSLSPTTLPKLPTSQ